MFDRNPEENDLVLFMSPEELERFSEAEQAMQQAKETRLDPTDPDKRLEQQIDRLKQQVQAEGVMNWMLACGKLRQIYRDVCQENDCEWRQANEDEYVKGCINETDLIRYRLACDEQLNRQLDDMGAKRMDTDELTARSQEASFKGDDGLAGALKFIAEHQDIFRIFG